MSKIKKINPTDLSSDEIFELMNSSTRDYIAARTLLINGLAGQGTILSVTCFEKILKTIIIKLGESFCTDGQKGHNLVILINTIKNKDANFFSCEDEKFLQKINNAYKIRYLISVQEDFKILLPSNIILTKLDNLYIKLIKNEPLNGISIGGKLFDMYEKGIMPKNQLICKNSYYNKELEEELLSSKQWCDKYEHLKGQKTHSLEFKRYFGGKIDSEWNIPNDF